MLFHPLSPDVINPTYYGPFGATPEIRGARAVCDVTQSTLEQLQLGCREYTTITIFATESHF